jgi:DNA-binding NtrC family response regulator
MEQSYTILVVEDDQVIRDFLIQVLPDAGYTTLSAEDARQALQLSQAYDGPIHLLLTDIVMPGQLSGWALARQLLQQRPDLKIIYMSGYPFVEDAFYPDLLQPGRNFLQKPFTLTPLLKIISGLLS